MYSDTGGDGPVVVLLHGVLMGDSLWNTVIEGLRDRCRCVVPELPFGAHTTPMPDGADLSLPAIATLIAEFLTELDPHEVTLVCNEPSPLRRPVQTAGSRGPVRELDRSAAPQRQGPPRPTYAPSPNLTSCSPGPTSSAASPARSSSRRLQASAVAILMRRRTQQLLARPRKTGKMLTFLPAFPASREWRGLSFS